MKLYLLTATVDGHDGTGSSIVETTRLVGEYLDGRPCFLTAAWFSESPNGDHGDGHHSLEIPEAVISEFEFTPLGAETREWALPLEMARRYL